MSVRAYKVKNIDFAKESSFNLWNDDAFVSWLERNTEFYLRLGEECSGMSGLEVAEIKRALAEIKDLDDYTRKQLEEDIKGLEDCEWIDYICF